MESVAKVLLDDEPTGNLDEDTADEVIELLQSTAHELGKCVIVVTRSKKIANIADERNAFFEQARNRKETANG